MSAIHRIETLRQPHGPDNDKVEAVVATVKTAKLRLRAVGAEHQLFANCLTMKKLVEKLDRTAQTQWLCYQAEHPNQMKRILHVHSYGIKKTRAIYNVAYTEADGLIRISTWLKYL